MQNLEVERSDKGVYYLYQAVFIDIVIESFRQQTALNMVLTNIETGRVISPLLDLFFSFALRRPFLTLSRVPTGHDSTQAATVYDVPLQT